ncbi:tyrosine-type recombinase/integrase [Pseudomonadota bacterium]
MALSDTQIRLARPKKNTYTMTDGKGMFLMIKPNGSKLWRYRYRLNGKQKPYAIGAYPEVSLAQAREELLAARKLVKEGIDPVQHRRSTKEERIAESEKTFKVLAKAWIENKRPDWAESTAKQVEDTFKRYVYPRIGSQPIKSITTADLLDVLEKMQVTAPSLAVMSRQWMSGVFIHAIVRRFAEIDPASMLRGHIRRQRPKKKKPLIPEELPDFLKTLEAYSKRSQVQRSTVIALHLILLTFVRTGELRNALWAEFKWDERLWRIPAERMKMRRDHNVPLSDQTLTFLNELHGITGHQELLFPNQNNPKEPMNKGTINAALAYMGYAGRLSGHAFRNTASTLLHEMDFNTDHIEMQLAHCDGGVRGRYNSAKYLDQRHVLMQEWADFLDTMITSSQ